MKKAARQEQFPSGLVESQQQHQAGDQEKVLERDRTPVHARVITKEASAASRAVAASAARAPAI